MKKAVWFVFFLSFLLSGCSGDQSDTGSELIIENVTLIDGTGAGPQVGVDIRISGGSIAEIGLDLSVSQDAETIDGSGKYVIPGLIDAHVHMDAPMVFQLTPEEKAQIVEHNPRAFLYNGVTAVLNVSSKVDWIFELRQAEREGRLMSPRIYAMGRSFTPVDGWGSRHGGALADADAAVERAHDYISRGTDGFKVIIEDGLGASGTYKRMSEDMMMAISKIARENDVPIYTHAINLDEFHSAVAMSSTAIVHGLEDPIPQGDTILQDMVEKNVMLVPTHSLWEAFLRHDEAAADLNDPVLRDSVPPFSPGLYAGPGIPRRGNPPLPGGCQHAGLPVGRGEDPDFQRKYPEGAPGRRDSRHRDRRRRAGGVQLPGLQSTLGGQAVRAGRIDPYGSLGCCDP